MPAKTAGFPADGSVDKRAVRSPAFRSESREHWEGWGHWDVCEYWEHWGNISLNQKSAVTDRLMRPTVVALVLAVLHVTITYGSPPRSIDPPAWGWIVRAFGLVR